MTDVNRIVALGVELPGQPGDGLVTGGPAQQGQQLCFPLVL
jgi:hypothetical protein